MIALGATALFLLPARAHAAVPSIQLFNNTTQSVDVINGAGRLLDVLPPGGRKIFAYRNTLLIRTADGRVLHYNCVPVPRDYGKGGFLSITYNAQLNPNLSISLIPPLANPPALDAVRQPPGFPLRPNS
jgi:hypothetical protein